MTTTTEPMTTASRMLRLTLALCACLAAMLACSGVASAGTYEVRQCDYATGNMAHNFGWQEAGQPPFIQNPGSNCSEFGLAVRNSNVGHAQYYPNGGYGGYYAYAPPGTVITGFSGYFGSLFGCCIEAATTYGAAFIGTGAGAARSYFIQGFMPEGSWHSPHGRSWNAGAAGWGGATSVGFYIRCGQPDYSTWNKACYQQQYGDLRFRGRSFAFTIRDDAPPGIAAPGGGLVSGNWVRGMQDLGFYATDTGGGLTGVTASFDNGTVLSSPSGCQTIAGHYIWLQPCPGARSGHWTVNTATLPNGPLRVTVHTTDAGGAGAQQSRTVYIDNSAPAAPMAPSVDGGQNWRPSNSFAVRWTNPGGQHAPIVRARYELCPVGGTACTTGSRDGNGIQNFDLAVPQVGAYSLRTWLEDAAGNVNPASKSDPVILRFDHQAPGKAAPRAVSRWLNDNDSADYPQAIGLDTGAFEPVSGIAGYSVTTNGSDPNNTIEAPGKAAVYRIPLLPEGITTVKARSVSGSGVASTTVGSTVIKVDKSRPWVAATSAPDPAVWLRGPATLRLRGTDQPNLSGMGAAPPQQPIEAGGYVAYRVGGQLHKVRGDSATVTVGDSGRHTVSYEAFDAAGNPSGERSVSFKIDSVPPSGSFDYQDPNDPRKLSVSVFDQVSGIASGQIQYRREGAPDFRSIDTTLTGGKLVARLDDMSMPDGRYEFRALVQDVAGNQASIDRRADGSSMTLTLPIRVTTMTRVVTGGGVKLSRCAAKAAKKKGAKRRRAMRKCKAKKVLVAPGSSSVSLAFGKRARAVGQVTTAVGVPVSNAYVTVSAQLRTGGPFIRIGAARADGQGLFRFMIDRGPSRTIRFSYEGTDTIRPSIGQLSTRVKAALSFKVNRRSVLNGQRVIFTGNLRGQPFPTGGKLVVLKAKVPGVMNWKTFGTVRTNAKGRYRYPRRFTSTFGLVRYQFRAEAPREVTYSYERGWSKITRVSVRGPGG